LYGALSCQGRFPLLVEIVSLFGLGAVSSSRPAGFR
jgi:hypothetical protein